MKRVPSVATRPAPLSPGPLPVAARPPEALPSAAPGRWPWPPLIRASAGLHAAAALAPLLSPEVWPWSLAAVALNHAGLTGAGLWPRSAVLGPNITRLDAAAAARGEIALTIDDGPDLVTTPAVLELLARRGVHATFFVIGERARAHPALVRALVEAGHDVQNHSLAHRHHFSVYGPGALRRDIGAAQQLLAELTGRRPHCFRAPAGLRSPLLDPVLHQLDLQLVSWTRRGFDTRDADPTRVLQRLTRGLAGGDILLLHDGNSRRSTAGQAVILDVLPGLIDRWQGAGLRAVTLRAALAPRRAAAPLPPDPA